MFQNELSDKLFNEDTNKSLPNSFYNEEIGELIGTLDKTQIIISLYKFKLIELKANVEEKEKPLKKYGKVMLKIYSLKNNLKTIYSVVELNSSPIERTKNRQYYEEVFEKSKHASLEYEKIFNKKIDDMKKNLFLTSTLKTSIENKNRQIIAKIKEINKFHNKKNYIGKNETKCGS